MIIVRLIGGIGNQFFQYALGRNVAIKNNTELKLDISGFEKYKLHNYGLNHFNIVENIATITEIQQFKPIWRQFFPYAENTLSKFFLPWYKQNYILEPDFSYNPDIFKLKKNAYLEGVWQSEKYFSDISEIIRKEISVKNEPDGLNQELLNLIQRTNSVNVHIRRGDYASNPKTQEKHGLLNLEYYINSLKLIEEKVRNPHLFVFSDDIPWVRENFKIDLPICFIDHNGIEKNYEDIRLMSSCRHHIIANSSFSWWGAWLSNNPGKIVIAPKRWFALGSLDKKTTDLIPSGWIQL